jgi:hypothetical protein
MDLFFNHNKVTAFIPLIKRHSQEIASTPVRNKRFDDSQIGPLDTIVCTQNKTIDNYVQTRCNHFPIYMKTQ